jgi:hypothetical protein
MASPNDIGATVHVEFVRKVNPGIPQDTSGFR